MRPSEWMLDIHLSWAAALDSTSFQPCILQPFFALCHTHCACYMYYINHHWIICHIIDRLQLIRVHHPVHVSSPLECFLYHWMELKRWHTSLLHSLSQGRLSSFYMIHMICKTKVYFFLNLWCQHVLAHFLQHHFITQGLSVSTVDDSTVAC